MFSELLKNKRSDQTPTKARSTSKTTGNIGDSKLPIQKDQSTPTRLQKRISFFDSKESQHCSPISRSKQTTVNQQSHLPSKSTTMIQANQHQLQKTKINSETTIPQSQRYKSPLYHLDAKNAEQQNTQYRITEQNTYHQNSQFIQSNTQLPAQPHQEATELLQQMSTQQPKKGYHKKQDSLMGSVCEFSDNSEQARKIPPQMQMQASKLQCPDVRNFQSGQLNFCVLNKDTGEMYDLRNIEKAVELTQHAIRVQQMKKNRLPWEEWWRQKKQNNLDFLLASQQNDFQRCSHLLQDSKGDLKAETNFCDQQTGWAPLHFACLNCNIQLVNKLIVNEANLNQETANNVTPLMIAVEQASEDLVILLLRAGILKFQWFMNELMIQQLIGADINAYDENGNTAIHIACMFNKYAIIDILLNRFKPDISIKNKNGKTCYELAKTEHGRKYFEHILQDRLQSSQMKQDIKMSYSQQQQLLHQSKSKNQYDDSKQINSSEALDGGQQNRPNRNISLPQQPQQLWTKEQCIQNNKIKEMNNSQLIPIEVIQSKSSVTKQQEQQQQGTQQQYQLDSHHYYSNNHQNHLQSRPNLTTINISEYQSTKQQTQTSYEAINKTSEYQFKQQLDMQPSKPLQDSIKHKPSTHPQEQFIIPPYSPQLTSLQMHLNILGNQPQQNSLLHTPSQQQLFITTQPPQQKINNAQPRQPSKNSTPRSRENSKKRSFFSKKGFFLAQGKENLPMKQTLTKRAKNPSRPLSTNYPSISQDTIATNVTSGCTTKNNSIQSIEQLLHGSTKLQSQQKVTIHSFIIHSMVGKGSFGDVYLVQKKDSDVYYAMKVLQKNKMMKSNVIKYALTERNVLSITNHPFIVKLNFSFQSEEKLFLILDFAAAGDMGKLLYRVKNLSEAHTRFYLSEILLALEDLHKRDIIFRDLKPDNIVIDAEGHALLTDFGLSKEGVLDQTEGAKSFCGSIAYLAPEMLKRRGHGKAVDWYLFGVVMYEMLTGNPPYYASSKEELFANIQSAPLTLPSYLSEEASSLLTALLERNPAMRLGCGRNDASEIKNHPFFKNVDWNQVLERKVKAPEIQLQQLNLNNYNSEQFIENLIGSSNCQFSDDKYISGWSFIANSKENII